MYDHVNRATGTLIESIKDSVKRNIASIHTELGLTPEQALRLTTVVIASIDEGYHRGYGTFERCVVPATKVTPKGRCRC